MPQTGDILISTLTTYSLSWGTNRYTQTRDIRTAERYIPILAADARRLELYNSNNGEGLGLNIFRARSTDGVYEGELKISGNHGAGQIEGKNISGNGSLQSITPWLEHHHARPGDQVRLEWTSPTDIEMTFIPQE